MLVAAEFAKKKDANSAGRCLVLMNLADCSLAHTIDRKHWILYATCDTEEDADVAKDVLKAYEPMGIERYSAFNGTVVVV